jgi:hypothetical protein
MVVRASIEVKQCRGVSVSISGMIRARRTVCAAPGTP